MINLTAIAVLILYVLSSEHGLVVSVDFSRSDRKRGLDVVENVIAQIQLSAIFSNDKLFLKNLAYFESEFGEKKGIFDGPRKGIWQIDQKLLDRTKSGLDQMLEKIQTTFDIKWSDVILQDMNKPLHNGLAARILIHMNGERVPARTETQMKIWRDVFHNGTNATDFEFFPSCKYEFADIVILIDGSNANTNKTAFNHFKHFTKELTDRFNFDERPYDERTRFSLVEFSDNPTLKIDINNNHNDGVRRGLIGGLAYDDKVERNTHKALDYLLDKDSFGPESEYLKARVAVLMTSGKSSDPTKTRESLQKVLKKGISVIIITVGKPFEVTDIYEPNLLTQLVWTDYKDDAFWGDEEVHEIICKVPVVIKPNGLIKKRKLTASQQFNCLLDTTNEFTLLEMKFGSLGQFLTSDTQGIFPSDVFFDKNTYVQGYGIKVEEFTKRKTVDIVPCRFKSFDLNETVALELLINSIPVSNPCDIKANKCPNQNCVNKFQGAFECQENACSSRPCLNNGMCSVDGTSFKCTCVKGFTGPSCDKKAKDSGKNSSPMAKMCLYVFVLCLFMSLCYM